MNAKRLTISVTTALQSIAFALPALVALAGPVQADPINLVQNGNFTNTSLSGNGGFLCANSGNTCTSQLGSWTSACSSVSCNSTGTPSSVLFAGSDGKAWNGGFGLYWNGIGDAPLGGNVVGIDGDPTYSSFVAQSIGGLKIGDTYSVQFYQAASQQHGLQGATTEHWNVSLGSGGAQSSTIMNTASQSAHPWMQQSMTFVATSISETLEFLAMGTPAGEPPVVLLGDVSLTDVPEPATLALALVGLTALFAMRKRPARV